MSTLLATLFVFALMMGAMAIGLVSGRRLHGSCGGNGGKCPCTDDEQRACALKRRQA